MSLLLCHPFKHGVDNFLWHLVDIASVNDDFIMANTYTGEIVVSLFDIAQSVRASSACTVRTRVYERIIRGDDCITEAMQRKHVNVCWELGPCD